MRLIDADALKEMICNNVYPITDTFNSQDYGMFWTGGIEKAIDEAPTIDAEPIVRCKDCKYWDYEVDNDVGFCTRTEDCDWNADDFCSRGERKNPTEF